MPRIVLITGASRGIGASIAEKFLKNNDIVYLNYNKSAKEALSLANKYPNAKTIKCDVSKEIEVQNMLNFIEKESGKLDIVVNNAGIAIDTLIEDKTTDNFKNILNVNLIGPFLVSKYAQKLMTKGSIINIASTNAFDTYYPYSLDYDASKAGLVSLTHNLAVLYAPNIRVNAVAPGWINTQMNQNLDENFKKEECSKILLNRFGEPEEVAELVFFLASPAASYINNTVIRIDGGFYR